MKVYNRIVCLLLSVCFVSCSSGTILDETEEGENTEVTIEIPQPVVSRATGDLSENALSAFLEKESTIQDVTVLVFQGENNAGGVLKGALNDENKIRITNVRRGLCEILVIANDPGEFTLAMKKAEVLEKLMTLPANQKPEELVMFGSEEATLVTTASSQQNNVTVEVKRMAARIVLKKAEIALKADFASFKITDVYLLNANTSYNIGGTATPVFATEGWAESFTLDWKEGLEAENAPYFYVTPNHISEEDWTGEDADWENATRLVIKGVWRKNFQDAGTEQIYTVYINRLQPGTEIDDRSSNEKGRGIFANTVYNLSVKITQGGDDEEPTTPCEVTLKVADWDDVNQLTEFEM